MNLNIISVSRKELPTAFIKGGLLHIHRDWLDEAYPTYFNNARVNSLVILGNVLSESWGDWSDVEGYRATHAPDTASLEAACKLLIYNHPDTFSTRESKDTMSIALPEFN